MASTLEIESTMSAPDSDLLSLNTATVRAQWKLPEIIAGCVRHSIRGIAPWRDQVAATGLGETAQRIRDAGLTVTGLCRGGMFPSSDREGRRRALDDNRRAVDEALALGARCLVLVVGGLPKDRSGSIVSKDLHGAREMVRDGIGELLQHAQPAGMPLAIEPLHPMYAADRACVNTLAHANALCDELAPNGTDGLGIAVDVYHVWWDPDLKQGIERAGAANRLLAYHICDWLVPTTDLLNDRGMMGDGVIQLSTTRGWMEASGYRGMHEVEIFSATNWWKRDADSVLATCRARHQECT
jgi:sugar phosphate isomerase/epimerase